MFDHHGGPVDPRRIRKQSDPWYFLEQCAHVQDRILEAIDQIPAAGKGQPVILLQSDHGYRDSRRPDRSRVPYKE